jgi:hypothetical protein
MTFKLECSDAIQPLIHRSQELWLQIEQRHICRVDKRSASTMSTLVDALRLSTLQVSS